MPLKHGRGMDAGVLLAYLAITIIMTWPLGIHLSGYILFGSRDDTMMLWNFWWFRYALQDLHTWPLHSDWLFHPLGTGLAFHTDTPLLTTLSIPIQNLWGTEVAYNLAILAAFVFSAFSAYLLAEYLTGSKLAAFPAGLVFAFSTFKFYQTTGHLNIISTEFFPLYVLFFIKLLREPTHNLRHALFAGICLALVFLIDYYQTVFLLFFSLCYLIYWLLGRQAPDSQRRVSQRSTWRPLATRLAVAVVAFLIVAAPLLLAIYRDISEGYYVRVAGDEYAANAASFFVPTSPLFNFLPFIKHINDVTLGGGDTVVYAGWTVVLLITFGAFMLVRKQADYRFWLMLLLLSFLLALGPLPHAFGHSSPIPGPFALWAAIPLLNNARVPARFDLLVNFTSAILVAYAVRELLTRWRWRPKYVTPAMLLLCALLLVEHFTVPMITEGRKLPDPSVYLAPIANTPGDFAVLNAPTYGGDVTVAMYNQMYHDKRIFAAYVARSLPDFDGYYRNERFIRALSTPRIGPGQPNADIAAALAQPNALAFYQRDAAQLAYYTDIGYIVAYPKALTTDGLRFLTSTLPLMQTYSDNLDVTQANVAVYRVQRDKLTVADPSIAIDLAERSSRMFALRGWTQPQSDSGSSLGYIRMTTSPAQLLTTVRTADDYTITLQLRSSAPQTLHLYVNDDLNPAASLTLSGSDWQTATTSIGAAHWQVGMNKLTLRLDKGATLDLKSMQFAP